MKRRFVIMWGFLAFFFMGSSCPQRYLQPAIKAVKGKTTVTVQDSSWYKCEVAAPGFPQLLFSWWCTRGQLVSTSGDSVQWFAPESSGIAIVGVEVEGQRGEKVRDSLIVVVMPRVLVFASWEGAVKGGSYVFCADSALQGYRLSGRSFADSRNLYLFLFDELNFLRWQNNEEFEFLIRRFVDDSSPFYDTIPTTGVYYLVLDNGRNFYEVNFSIEIQLTSP
ncbi:MAG: hypothetical protein ACUVUD_00385 [bacterium]